MGEARQEGFKLRYNKDYVFLLHAQMMDLHIYMCRNADNKV